MIVKNTLLSLILLVALNVFAQAPQLNKIEKAREHFNQGLQHGLSNNYHEAINEFSKAIELNPLYAGAFLYNGLAKIEVESYEQAIRDLTVAIELDPGYSDQAHYFRGIARYHLKEYLASIDDLSVAIRMNPDFVAFYQRGKANLQLKEYKRSLQDFEISIRLNPDFHDAYLYRGINLYYLNEFELAIEDLEVAKKHLPQNAKGFYYSGLARNRVQNNYVAVEDFSKAIELDPSFAQAYQGRAMANAQTGNHQTSEKDRIHAMTLQHQQQQQQIQKPSTATTSPTTPITENAVMVSSATDINFANLFERQNTTQPQTTSTQVSDQSQVIVAGPVTARLNGPVTVQPTPQINDIETGIYNRKLEKIARNGFGVQVASYSNTDNLLKLAEAYQEKYNTPVAISISKVNDRKLYKLIIGQYSTREQAEKMRDNLRSESFPDSFLVVYENL
jgi:tetratricopeptide (TPR) repeat protein